MIGVFRTAPIVMTDDLFVAYQGQTGTSSAATRQAAFVVAESWMEMELRAFLEPTTVTGTFLWPYTDFYSRIHLPHNYLQTVDSVAAIHRTTCSCGTTELTGCAIILHAETGIITVRECASGILSCTCDADGTPYQVRVAYTSGLPSGIAVQYPPLLRALTMVSQAILDDMLEPEKLDGGAGDPGVQRWSDSGYAQVRINLWESAFGSSPNANMARRLVEQLKQKRAMKL